MTCESNGIREPLAPVFGTLDDSFTVDEQRCAGCLRFAGWAADNPGASFDSPVFSQLAQVRRFRFQESPEGCPRLAFESGQLELRQILATISVGQCSWVDEERAVLSGFVPADY